MILICSTNTIQCDTLLLERFSWSLMRMHLRKLFLVSLKLWNPIFTITICSFCDELQQSKWTCKVSIFYKWSTMRAKKSFIMEFKTVTILKCKQKPLTKDPWATSLTWENSSNQQTHMIIIMLIERRKNPLFTLWEFNGSSFEQTWIEFSSPKDALEKMWFFF